MWDAFYGGANVNHPPYSRSFLASRYPSQKLLCSWCRLPAHPRRPCTCVTGRKRVPRGGRGRGGRGGRGARLMLSAAHGYVSAERYTNATQARFDLILAGQADRFLEGATRAVHRYSLTGFYLLFFFSSFILRRMGKNKALAHHTSTYFHTRRVSIQLSCFRSPTLAGAPFGSRFYRSLYVSRPTERARQKLNARQMIYLSVSFHTINYANNETNMPILNQ